MDGSSGFSGRGWQVFVLGLVLCLRLVGDEIVGDEFAEFESELEAKTSEVAVADPLAPLNRGFYWVNDRLYFWVLKPVAQGYELLVPERGRVCVENFFDNLQFPVRFVNSELQLKKRTGN